MERAAVDAIYEVRARAEKNGVSNSKVKKVEAEIAFLRLAFFGAGSLAFCVSDCLGYLLDTGCLCCFLSSFICWEVARRGLFPILVGR